MFEKLVGSYHSLERSRCLTRWDHLLMGLSRRNKSRIDYRKYKHTDSDESSSCAQQQNNRIHFLKHIFRYRLLRVIFTHFCSLVVSAIVIFIPSKPSWKPFQKFYLFFTKWKCEFLFSLPIFYRFTFVSQTISNNNQFLKLLIDLSLHNKCKSATWIISCECTKCRKISRFWVCFDRRSEIK